MAARRLISRFPAISVSSSLAARSTATGDGSCSIPRASPLLWLRLHPILALTAAPFRGSGGPRCFSTQPTIYPFYDAPSPSNLPPTRTILDSCDFKHWMVVTESPDPSLSRDEIIDSYIKTLAQVLGSEEEARKSIYSVMTKLWFGFGANVSDELANKIEALPKVLWVLPDAPLDDERKVYAGEPFANGQAAPYDPKYNRKC